MKPYDPVLLDHRCDSMGERVYCSRVSLGDMIVARVLQGMAASNYWSANFVTAQGDDPDRLIRIAVKVSYRVADLVLAERAEREKEPTR